MIYPAQTSLIPATVALVRWIEANGFGGLYPYWYLGTTPVKYLIGPVVPGILIGLHKVLPEVSLFDLSIFTLITSHLLLSIGWGILANRLGGNRMVGWWVGFLTFIIPWHWVSGLALSELSAVAAGALTPWVLWIFARGPVSRFLPASARSGQKSVERGVDQADLRAVGNPSTTATPRKYLSMVNGQLSIVPVAGAFALLLLTNAVAAIPAIVGMVILGIILSKRWKDGLKRAGFVIFAGWLIATLWYGPGYWLTIWGAPSLGGRSAFFALGWVIDMFRGLVPFILAVGVVLVGIRPKDVYSKFAFSWFGVFALLTLIRFMADPDFWMDWTAWMGEVEVGVALVFGRLAAIKKRSTNLDTDSAVDGQSRSSLRPATPIEKDIGILAGLRHVFDWRQGSRAKTIYFLLFTIYFFVGWFWAYKARDFWLPRKSIENTVEFRIANWLSNNSTIQPASQAKRGEQSNNPTRVFLSGTTAFWLNSLVDVRQVRGGVDHASVDSNWREAAWVIRQGESNAEIVKWTGKLNIDYIVVHTEQSKEFYHDFENPGVFEGISILSKIYDDQGDFIYALND